jgi:pilus assembly protein CpaE
MTVAASLHRVTIDAFAASAETQACLREAAQAPALRRCRLGIQGGGLAGAIEHYAERGTPQLVLVEAADGDDLFALLDRLADVCAANTRVLVIGGANDIQLYRTLLQRGISDYLPRPLSGRQIAEAIAALFADSRNAPRGRTYAFFGVRGGAGSSIVAQNFAWHLGRHLAEPVIYVDLDLWFGTSLLAFNLEAKQTAADALAHPERLDEVLMERCLIDYDDNLRILASAGDCRIAPALSLDAVETLIDIARKLAAAVVLDLPRHWTDWTRHCLEAADETVITALPDFASIRDGKTLVEGLAAARGTAPARLLLNKVESGRKTQLTAKDFQEALGVAPSLSLPFEPGLFGEAATLGQMLGEVNKSHKAVLAFEQLAASLAGKAPAVKRAARGTALLHWLRR